MGNTLSRNPNLCASCSSLTDGMTETNVESLPDSAASVPAAISANIAKAAPQQSDPPNRANPSG
jgi:hypothetical protein